MRNLIISFSILCFALSGIITFKALNLPEKKPPNPAALSQTNIHALQDTVKQLEQKLINKYNVSKTDTRSTKNTISQLEQKLANEIAASQINIQTLQDTVKQLEQKLTNEDNVLQTDAQAAKNTITELEQKLSTANVISQENINALQDKINTQAAKKTIFKLKQKLATANAVSQKNINALQDKIKQLKQKPINKDNVSQTDIQTSKNIIAQQKHTPASLKNISQSKLNIREPENTEKILTVFLGDVAFNSGQVKINANMTKLIQKSTQQILSLPHFRVIVEGHTDNIPISKKWQKRYKDNMSLSFLRAIAVAHEFEKQGVSVKRISVIGYGDTRPIASNDTVDGRAKNRRVIVRLIPEEKEI